MNKQRGCLAANSLSVGGTVDAMKIKGINRYQNFGLRAELIKILFENLKTFWENNRMGPNIMILSFEIWGQEIGLLIDKRTFVINFDKLKSLGEENLKLWGFFWRTSLH